MAVVSFDVSEFRDVYPQFSDFTDAQLEHAFNVATLVLRNTERSHVPYNPPEVMDRKTLLYLLVCHLCELAIRGNGIVGSVTNATEGSVSAGFSVPQNPKAAWFQQTQCGATAWQILLGYVIGGKLYRGCFR